MKTKDFPSVIAAGKATAKQLERYTEQMQKRSPWFNARTQPPVRGGVNSMYETRCVWVRSGRIHRASKEELAINGYVCSDCQWRGLLKEKK